MDSDEREESLNYPTSEILKRIERYVKYLWGAGYFERGMSGSRRGNGKPAYIGNRRLFPYSTVLNGDSASLPKFNPQFTLVPFFLIF